MEKTTITIDTGLHSMVAGMVGDKNVDAWVERLVQVTLEHMENSEPSEELYQEYAAMAADEEHEREAAEWTKNTFQDFSAGHDETR